jgi:hypothetical protein
MSNVRWKPALTMMDLPFAISFPVKANASCRESRPRSLCCPKITSKPTRCRIPQKLRGIGVFEYHERLGVPYSVFFRVYDKSADIVAVFDRSDK